MAKIAQGKRLVSPGCNQSTCAGGKFDQPEGTFLCQKATTPATISRMRPIEPMIVLKKGKTHPG